MSGPEQQDRAGGAGREPAPGVLDAVRDGWHALGGGDAASCPGCPVCRLSESAARLDPGTAAHLQLAVGHVVAAGRELLAALGPPDRAPRPDPRDGPSDPGSTTGAGGADGDRFPDPPVTPTPTRTRIPVHTPPTRPRRGNEEQE